MNRIKEILEGKGIKQTWLAERLDKSYNMVNSYVQNRRQPSVDDLFRIASILGVSAQELLVAAKDMVEKSVQPTPTLNVKEMNAPEVVSEMTIKVPLVGNILHGADNYTEQNVEALISVSVRLINKADQYFILKANGDSMNKAGINDGDHVLIRRQDTATNGDKVVAIVDNETTIKVFHQDDNLIVLKPESDDKEHQPIILTSDFKVEGVVETVIPILNK